MSDTEPSEGTSGGGAWQATLQLLERIIFTPGIAAVGKLLLILAVVVGLVIIANRAGVPMPWGGAESVVSGHSARE